MAGRAVEHFDALVGLLTLEQRHEAQALEQARAELTLGELEAQGLVVLDVEATDESRGLGGRHLVTLQRKDGRPLPARLGPGDMVRVSPRRAEVEAAPSALVSRASRTSLTLAFDRVAPPFVSEGRLRLDVLSSDVTFQRMADACRAVKGWDQGQLRDRREVLLENQPPRTEKPQPLELPLNAEQAEAAARALAARDYFLVHGPPGTGKSTVLGHVARRAAEQGHKVLLTAASNAAVDHLLEVCLEQGLKGVRVGHPARVLPHLVEHTLDELVDAHPDRIASRELFDEGFELLGFARKQRTQGRSRQRFSEARSAQAEAGRCFDEARALEKRAVAQVLDGAQVVAATLATCAGHTVSGLRFDLALVDEAAQAVEPLTLLAFLRAPKVVLAGDPQQLPPTVKSQDAAAKGLAVSLFERLHRASGSAACTLLKEQHRFHAALMEFPSATMYGGALRAHPDAAGRTLATQLKEADGLDAPPLLFLDTAGKGFEEAAPHGGASLANDGEAQLVLARARELLRRGLSPTELAIISPYRAQAQRLAEALSDVPQVEVDTIDAFQGREKDAVLVSLVRSNGDQALGFLEDLRRMNVALTRARRHLFVVGDSATLGGHRYFAGLVETAQKQGGYRSAWEWAETL
ncbi:MAG: DNA2/NAM7 family helicase [Myxococcaceae bacterium]|nr:DNA2/NAM7 family helicase [Myxococcaceae bacterium]